MENRSFVRSEIGVGRTADHGTCLMADDLAAYAVCGSASESSGDAEAARLAVGAIERSLAYRCDLPPQRTRQWCEDTHLEPAAMYALRRASRDVFEVSSADERVQGMACTATLLLVGDRKAAMAHVGNGRLYLIRDRTALQLSEDHTVAAELVRVGDLAPDQVPSHPHRTVLTRAVGYRPFVDVDSLVFDVCPDDRLLLCSDGLADAIPSADWLARHCADYPLADLPEALLAHAVAAGGREDATVLVIDVGPRQRLRTLRRASVAAA